MDILGSGATVASGFRTDDVETLTPTEAAHLAGAPAAQLHRWAWLGTGPRNVGTKRKPLYLERDVREWRGKYENQGELDATSPREAIE